MIHTLNQSDVYNVLNKKAFGKYVIQLEQEGAMPRYHISLADQEYSQNGPPMEQYKGFQRSAIIYNGPFTNDPDQDSFTFSLQGSSRDGSNSGQTIDQETATTLCEIAKICNPNTKYHTINDFK